MDRTKLQGDVAIAILANRYRETGPATEAEIEWARQLAAKIVELVPEPPANPTLRCVACSCETDSQDDRYCGRCISSARRSAEDAGYTVGQSLFSGSDALGISWMVTTPDGTVLADHEDSENDAWMAAADHLDTCPVAPVPDTTSAPSATAH